MSLRIGIIGPGRTRGGTGEFVARELHSLGADVRAVVASTPESGEKASVRLKEAYGIEAAPYQSTREMYDKAGVEAVAICTPTELHLENLREAFERKVHVFAEKPLIWTEDLDEMQSSGGELIGSFFRSGLTLHVNAQWPYTLRHFEEIYGDVRKKPAKSFTLELCPAEADPEYMLRESLPHGASMLFALGAGGFPEDVSFRSVEPSGDRGEGIEVCFTLRDVNGGEMSAKYVFTHKAQQPRPAAYEVNGNRAERVIENPGYRQFFVAGDKKIELEDPLKASVRDFLEKVRFTVKNGRAATPGDVVWANAHLAMIMKAYYEAKQDT